MSIAFDYIVYSGIFIYLEHYKLYPIYADNDIHEDNIVYVAICRNKSLFPYIFPVIFEWMEFEKVLNNGV